MPQQVLDTYVADAVARTRAADDKGVADDFAKEIGKAKDKVPFSGGDLPGWAKRLPRNIGMGLFRATLNTIETIDDAFQAGAKLFTEAEGEKKSPLEDIEPVAPLQTLFPGMFEAAHNFADEVEEQNTTPDSIIQGIAQFVIPFTSYLKAMNGLKNISTLARIGKLALAEGVTSASAFGAHEGRVADLIEMGRQMENDFGALLNKVSPEGSLANSYIEWMTDRENEGEFEGRYKNAVDSLVSTAGIASLFKVVGTSFKVARQAVENFGTKGPLQLQRGSIGTKSNLTPAENKFFDEVFGNEFDRAEILEEIPGVTFKNGRLEVPAKSVDALTKYIDDTVVLRAGETMEPRLPPSFHKDTFAEKFVRSSARAGSKE